ncbi:MAG: phospholipid carrier-dependent glycosyltransferase [Deltaproteobacteria bacterium]|nr:phospholipid carrier-dependent glycosyltransferase [Deltaproteobacteria bacterium]
MTAQKKYGFTVLVLVAFLYILPLGVRPMFVPDESRYAEIPREMIATGNWVSPHLNAIRYFEKPVFGYWATAASLMAFGENNFAIRFPSALSVALSALFIFWLVSKEAREDETTAPLAALIFITTLEVYAVGTFCVLDSLLSFFITGTMAFFYLATLSPSGSGKEKKSLLLAGIFCGLAFLTKGFLAFIVPVLAIVPYLLSQRRFADILRMAWLPLLAALLVTLPWSILIHQREPEFWNFFFWNEHVRRFLAHDAQHRESFWYFFLISPPMFLPWIFLAPAAGLGLFVKAHPGEPARKKHTPLITYCLCWLICPFLFFSVSSGKLLTYILPCFPPFAILLAAGLQRLFKKGGSRSFQLGATGAVITSALFFIAIIAILIATRLLGIDITLLPENPSWKWLTAANGLLMMMLFLIVSIRSKEGSRKIFLFGLAPACLLFAANFIMPDLTLEKKAPDLLLKRHHQEVTADSLIFSSEETAPNTCWNFKRDNVYLVDSPGELEFGVQFADAKSKLVDLSQARRLIERNQGKAILIATAKDYEQWQKQLPEPALLDNNGEKGYVFVKF